MSISIINMIFKQLSITTKAVTASLTQISTNIDNAARDLGANKLLVFKDILLPNLKQAFATGFINNFTSAMTTAGAVIFLITPGKKIAVFTLFVKRCFSKFQGLFWRIFVKKVVFRESVCYNLKKYVRRLAHKQLKEAHYG